MEMNKINVQLDFEQFLQMAMQLPLPYKTLLFQKLTAELKNQPTQEPFIKWEFGAGKHLVEYVAPDFNEPLEEFNDYMP